MPRGRPKKNQGEDVLLKSAELIGWALGGLEREIVATRARLSTLTTQATKLRARLGTRATPLAGGSVAAATFDEPAVTGRKRRRRRMSPEARKRISEMMKKRWAERRKGK